ncbi:hypothetical protein AJ80_08357 [Polytolypa hystricis UAMH7299]|uniref:N-acetyltransferase domain-containing protein n=1 Tax=Polytolypa hystricis (strain UAMH7299) TaxID=1447883 RepID=A0A2B7X915_POLH7|nr:hypothetical protein AJ80_08357 [Polytolypa hystricis UAMH7299]
MRGAKILQVPKTLSSPSLQALLCQRFKTARLRALQEDPSAFSSAYETEALFADEIWAKRLLNPASKTFVAVWCCEREEEDVESGDQSDIDVLVENEWLGMVVLLGPRTTAATPPPAAVSTTSPSGPKPRFPWSVFLPPNDPFSLTDPSRLHGSEAAYLAVSMFVLREVRRQQLGRKLIEASVEAVRDEVKALSATRGNIGLGVIRENVAARRLYERLGFEYLPVDDMPKAEGEAVEMGMARIVEMDAYS